MIRTGIKPKVGVCPDCTDTVEKPTIGGKCKYHYWQGKRTPIKASTQPIRKRSAKMAKSDTEYFRLKKTYMERYPICEVRGCRNVSTDLHHKKGRGIHYTDPEYFMAVCRPCHNRFDTETKWAMDNGYVLSRLKK